MDTACNETTEEFELLNQLVIHNGGVGSSARRRQMKKGTGVVLNAAKIKKFEDREQKLLLDEADRMHNFMARKIQRFYRQFSRHKTMLRCISRIQYAWIKFKAERYNRFLLCGMWTTKQSNAVFGLLLGWKVRMNLKQNSILLKIKQVRDVQNVLVDMCHANSFCPRCLLTVTALAVKDNKSDDKPQLSFTESDWKFIRQLGKQLLGALGSFHVAIFGSSRWFNFPPPGYLHLYVSDVSSLCLNRMSTEPSTRTGLPRTPPMAQVQLAQSQHKMNTPSRQHRAEANKISGLSSQDSTPLSNGKPQSLQDIMNSRKPADMLPQAVPYDGSEVGTSQKKDIFNQDAMLSSPSILDERPIKPMSSHSFNAEFVDSTVNGVDSNISPTAVNKTPRNLFSGGTPSSSVVKSKLRIHSSPSAATTSSQLFPSTPTTCVDSTSKRKGAKPHIQLDIISAERLALARKGPPVRDSLGDIVPDRKPGFRVTMYLPPLPSAGNAHSTAESKKVFCVVKDFEEVTQNPKWNESIYIPLPISKSLIPAYAMNAKLDDSKRLEACKGLLNWWGEGYIKVQVIDGDRFNSEIFLGEAQLLMSSFLVPVKGKEKLVFGGTFPLNKVQPTDRVTGSIKLHAYLHLPEAIWFISEPASASKQLNDSSLVDSPPSSRDTSYLAMDKSTLNDSNLDYYGENENNASNDSMIGIVPVMKVDNLNDTITLSSMRSTAARMDEKGQNSSQFNLSSSKARSAQISSLTKCLDSLASMELLDASILGGSISRMLAVEPFSKDADNLEPLSKDVVDDSHEPSNGSPSTVATASSAATNQSVTSEADQSVQCTPTKSSESQSNEGGKLALRMLKERQSRKLRSSSAGSCTEPVASLPPNP